MLNLINIEIQNTSIANIDVLKKQIADSFDYLDTLKVSQNDDFETICNNLKISSDIEEGCKKSITNILNKTGDINELVSSLEKMQKEARFIRLDLEKSKKQFKEIKINNFNSSYFNTLTLKAKEFASNLPKCNIEEEIRKFYSDFISINFKGVKEQDLDAKHEKNEIEVDNYLNNLEFKIKAFNQSPFINNFIPISIKFINNNLIIEFNNNQYTALDYDKVKAEYDLLVKTQQEQEESIAKEKALMEEKLKQKQDNDKLQKDKAEPFLDDKTINELKVLRKEANIQAEMVDYENQRRRNLLFKVKNILNNKVNNITEKDIVNLGAGKLSITIIINKEEMI